MKAESRRIPQKLAARLKFAYYHVLSLEYLCFLTTSRLSPIFLFCACATVVEKLHSRWATDPLFFIYWAPCLKRLRTPAALISHQAALIFYNEIAPRLQATSSRDPSFKICVCCDSTPMRLVLAEPPRKRCEPKHWLMSMLSITTELISLVQRFVVVCDVNCAQNLLRYRRTSTTVCLIHCNKWSPVAASVFNVKRNVFGTEP